MFDGGRDIEFCHIDHSTPVSVVICTLGSPLRLESGLSQQYPSSRYYCGLIGLQRYQLLTFLCLSLAVCAPQGHYVANLYWITASGGEVKCPSA